MKGESVVIVSCLVLYSSSSINYNEECTNSIRNIGTPRTWRQDNDSHPLTLISAVVQDVHLYSQVPTYMEAGERRNFKLESRPILSCLDQDNQQLVQVIREHVLENEDEEPYNLTLPLHTYLKNPATVPEEVDDLVFQGRLKGGFFIEAGASDFQTDSDTLYFELKHGWTGLLVEPNPASYSKGRYKHRKAFSVQTCLSPVKTPATIIYDLEYLGLILTEKKPSVFLSIQCFPLYSLLLAVGNPTVNYFSLDIEGGEFQVLQTIPWSKVDIQVLSVETHYAGQRSEGTREDLIQYMKSVGYQHIPGAHKVTNVITIYETGETHGLLNDLFVKNGIQVHL